MRITHFGAALAASLLACAVAHGAPMKALIVDGQHLHEWKVTTPILKRLLEETGLFTVDVATTPPTGADMRSFHPNFAAYRLVVMNYSGDPWPAPTQRSFEDYVSQGGGLAIVHAADNSFPHWKAYNEMAGLGGWMGRNEKDGPYVYWKDGKIIRDMTPGHAGSHGQQRPILLVVREKQHPITKGLPEKFLHAADELYGTLRGPAKNLTVLATAFSNPATGGTGREEPMLMTIGYGKGRVFHTVLGHAGKQMASVAFIVTFQRGAEWAATGKVTQPVPADFPGAELPSLRSLEGQLSNESRNAALPPAPMKALVVDGQNNHNWKETTPILKRLLEETGLFSVDVATSPPEHHEMSGFHPNFAAYRVVVMNYNGDEWSVETKRAFEDYVAGGGGVVLFHAADNSFPHWKAFNEMAGIGGWYGRNEKDGPYVYWKDGRIVRDTTPGIAGDHGAQRPIRLNVRNKEHPITKGLPERFVHAADELYGKLRGPAENLTVLATAFSNPAIGGTGREEPVLMTIGYGKGRIFHNVLGHAGKQLQSVALIVLLQRGAEWAATGKVTQRLPADFPGPDRATLRPATRNPSHDGKRATNGPDRPWVVYEGGDGPGKGKHVVLVSGDEEYRSEEVLPQLGKILARRHGFKCTVLFAVDPATGTINPKINNNIPGLEALKTADLMLLFVRWRKLPREQMRHIVDYVRAGKPILGMRTATHAFDIDPGKPFAEFAWNHKGGPWDGGFGRHLLGETWIDHHGRHGHESTLGVIAPGAESSPIVRGCEDIWVPTDVYKVRLPLPGDSRPLVLGMVLSGMSLKDRPLEGPKNYPMMPIAWTKTCQGAQGQVGRVFTTTMGSGMDFKSEGLRRLVVNAVYWCVGLEDKIPARANVNFVGPYKPSGFSIFGGFRPGVKPSDHAMSSLASPAADHALRRLDYCGKAP